MGLILDFTFQAFCILHFKLFAVIILMNDSENNAHYLLIELEQYASGSIRDKVVRWTERHFENSNTTTFVVSLVLHAFSNRIVNEFSNDTRINEMISSKDFKLFQATSYGEIDEEFKFSIRTWIEQKL